MSRFWPLSVHDDVCRRISQERKQRGYSCILKGTTFLTVFSQTLENNFAPTSALKVIFVIVPLLLASPMPSPRTYVPLNSYVCATSPYLIYLPKREKKTFNSLEEKKIILQRWHKRSRPAKTALQHDDQSPTKLWGCRSKAKVHRLLWRGDYRVSCHAQSAWLERALLLTFCFVFQG